MFDRDQQPQGIFISGLTPEPSAPAPAAGGSAHWGYRVGGGTIDLLLPFAVAAAIDAAGNSSDDAEAAAGLALFGVWLLNMVVLAAITNGRSAGKLVAGTRVVRENGRRFGVGMAFLRDVLARLIYVIPFVFLVDAFMPLGERRQTLRDRMVNTRVVQEPSYRARAVPLPVVTVLVFAATIFFFAQTDAFDTDRDYSAYDREVFIDGCMDEGGSEAGCACAFENIREQLTFAEYARADRQEEHEWSPKVARVMANATDGCPG